jgi:hypothetical protein
VRSRIAAGLVAAVFAAGFGGVAAPLDGEQAAVLLVERILPELDIVSDYVAFLHPVPLGADDELAPYAPTPIPDDVDRLPHLVPYELTGPTWFAWIDLRPYARYAHDALFVLIDANEGTYAVHRETWWPVLNGTSLWVDADDYWDEGKWVASSLPAGVPAGASAAICEADRSGGDYYDWALVVNGWSPGQPGEAGFSADARGVCEALNGLGMRVSTLEPEEVSPEALEAFVVRLFTEIPLYDCCDRLYFYFTCHASPGALWIGGQRLSSVELARMLTFPGDTYVPSRVYVMLEAGYGGSFIPDLSPHGNINRVWTASAADRPAYDDLDPAIDPNPEDSGGEWTSSFLAALDALLQGDAVAMQAAEFGREYMPLNMACRSLASLDAAALSGRSEPADYLLTDGRTEYLLAAVEYLAGYDRAHHRVQGNLDERIARYEEAPCLEFLWFLHNTARHDTLPAPTPEFSYRILKGYAKDVAHSDWWEFCDLFWEVFTTPSESE